MIIEKIQNDIIIAMKAKDSVRLGTLRMIMSEIKNAEIDFRASGKELNDDEVLKIIVKEAKKRRESIEVFEKSGRNDLSESEKAELKVIDEYLPGQMSESEILKEIEEIIASSADKNFGTIMRLAMEKLKGRADGKLVTQIVKRHI